MVGYRPHTAVIKWKGTPSQNNDGIFTDVAGGSLPVDCRFVPQGSGRYVIAQNGNKVILTYKVFLDVPDEVIPEGAIIEWQGKEYKILNMNQFQKHAEIWI